MSSLASSYNSSSYDIMKILLFFLLCFFLLQISTSNGHPNIIQKTCKKGSSNDSNFNYTLCINLFTSYPKSRISSLQGLAVIATKLSKTEAKTIRIEVKKQLKMNKSKRKIKSCLKSCLELYSSSISDLKSSIKKIKSGKYDDANLLLSSVVDTPGTCEDGFSEFGVKWSLTKENDEFYRRSVLALGIVSMLQG